MTKFRRHLSRTSIILAAFITIVTLGTASLARSNREGAPPAIPSASAPADAAPVSVVKVIDGDTLDVLAATTTLRVRLYGVDTPERGDACYAEATARLTALAGSRVLLVPDERTTDHFGRELRYVFTANGQSIDDALVREGLALAWREDGSRRDALVAVEEAARASKTGCLWSSR